MTTTPVADKASLWNRIPTPFKWAVVTAALGFVASVSTTTEKVVNGVRTECSYIDFGALALAAITVALVVSGVVAERRKTYDRLRLEPALLVLLAVVLLAAAAWHVVTGLGTVGGPCN